jgi:hypothetical protein
MGGQDRIITTVLQPRELSAAHWDEIWILTQEFFEVERPHAENELRARQRIALFHMNGSYKSYLLLPRNFRHFWPRHDRPTPPACAALIDQLAVRLYGAAWRSDLGVVMRSGQRRLRETAAPLILTRDSDPNLAFFSRANPGHPEGDMLLCLCPLTLSNWLSLANRAFQRFRRRSPH